MCWRDSQIPMYYPRIRTCEVAPEVRETVLSTDRLYCYVLWRHWPMPLVECICGGHENTKYVMFVGLNPSTADETKDDNTIRKCVKYAKAWGYGALCMANLFAYRATDPRQMKKYPEPVGPDNDEWLKRCARKASVVIAAWGKDGKHMKRDLKVEKLLSNLQCLGQNHDGSPKHPLYLLDTAKPDSYWLKEPF